MSKPKRGVRPWERGESWLGVGTTESFPSPLLTNQAQPLPKSVAAASLNFFLKSSKLPNSLLMIPPRSPLGSPPLPAEAFGEGGSITFQKKEWLKCPPP